MVIVTAAKTSVDLNWCRFFRMPPRTHTLMLTSHIWNSVTFQLHLRFFLETVPQCWIFLTETKWFPKSNCKRRYPTFSCPLQWMAKEQVDRGWTCVDESTPRLQPARSSYQYSSSDPWRQGRASRPLHHQGTSRSTPLHVALRPSSAPMNPNPILLRTWSKATESTPPYCDQYSFVKENAISI